MKKEIITEDFFDKLHKNTFWIYSKVMAGVLMITSIVITTIGELDLIPSVEALPKLEMNSFYLSITSLFICLVSIIIKEIILVFGLKIKQEIKDVFVKRDYGEIIVMIFLFIIGVFVIGLVCLRFFKSLLYVCSFISLIIN